MVSSERFSTARARRMAATLFGQTSIPVEGLITLTGGTPDFPTPPHVIEAGRKALADGHTRYTPWPGIPELREAIAEKLWRDNQLKVDPGTQVLVTAGSQAAMLITAMALVGPGEEVLIPAPFYDEYRRDLILAGGILTPVPTKMEDSFEVDPDVLEAAITPKTKGIILVTPSNPTGGIIRGPVLERIAQIAQEHDLFVVSDELYEYFIYDDYEHVSIGALDGMQERTITLNSFSKCYGMTGWRVGYLAAAPEIVRAILPIHHCMSICAASVSQWAALAALTGPQDWFDEILETFDRRRHIWMEALDEMGLPYGYPQGAYLLMYDVSSTGLSTQEFAQVMSKEAGVRVGGGGSAEPSPFTEGLIRGSMAVPTEQLEEGLERMKPVVARLND